MNYNTQTIEIIINYLNSINIKVVPENLSHDTFLPGLQIKGSTLFFDREKLKYFGDMLHESRHIAVAEEHTRALIGSKNNDNNWPPDNEEIATILWS